MENHPAFTKDNRELFSDLAVDIYSLSQIFQDYPEDSRESALAKQISLAFDELSDLVCAE